MKRNLLMILLLMNLLTNSTSAATILRKGEVAAFDGALLSEVEMRDVLKDSSFRLKVEPLMMLPLEGKPENRLCAGMGTILGVSVGLSVDLDNRSNQVVLLSLSALSASYILLTCL